MKIVSSGMQMASSHASVRHHEVQESLRMWVGDRQPDRRDNGRSAVPAAPTVSISEAGRAAQGSDVTGTGDAAETVSDPRLTLLRLLFRYLTGKDIDVVDARDLEPTQPPPEVLQAPNAAGAANAGPSVGWGVAYDRHESYSEAEVTQIAASGTANADGRWPRNPLHAAVVDGAQLPRGERPPPAPRRRGAPSEGPAGDQFRRQRGTTARPALQFRSRCRRHCGKKSTAWRPAAVSFVFDRNGDGRANDGSELFGGKERRRLHRTGAARW